MKFGDIVVNNLAGKNNPYKVMVYISGRSKAHPDGVDTIINIMSGGKVARQLINCPVDILYLPD